MKNVGQKIKMLRLKKGLSQTDVARSAKISRQTLSALESNKIAPSDNIKLSLSEFYNVPLEYFTDDLNRSNDMMVLKHLIKLFCNRGDINADGDVVSEFAKKQLYDTLLNEIKELVMHNK